MWILILIAYIILTYIDTKAFTKLKEKGVLPVYIFLMLISCFIITYDFYTDNMPSPANPIRNLVKSITGY